MKYFIIRDGLEMSGAQIAEGSPEFCFSFAKCRLYHTVFSIVIIFTDFSVVLFRSDFILFSEENRMKVHENQWVLTMPCLLEHLAGATSRGQTMTPEGQKPSQWLCLAKFPRERYSQPIVYKALSWSAIRKSACILAEITIRKSQFIALVIERGIANPLAPIQDHYIDPLSISGELPQLHFRQIMLSLIPTATLVEHGLLSQRFAGA